MLCLCLFIFLFSCVVCLLKPGRKKKKKNRGKEIVCQLGSVLAFYDISLWHRLMNKGITHVLIVRSTLERRLDPKFPTELKYQIVEVRSTYTQKGHESRVDNPRIVDLFVWILAVA